MLGQSVTEKLNPAKKCSYMVCFYKARKKKYLFQATLEKNWVGMLENIILFSLVHVTSRLLTFFSYPLMLTIISFSGGG